MPPGGMEDSGGAGAAPDFVAAAEFFSNSPDFSEETPTPDPGTPDDAGTPDGTETTVDAAAPPTYKVPENDDDLKPYREQKQPWAEELALTRAEIRRMAAATPAAPPEWEELTKLGPVEDIKRNAEIFNLLYRPMVDDQGNPVLNEATQTPRYTAIEGLQKLQVEAPSQARQIFYDQAAMVAPSGLPYLAEFLKEEFNVDPETLGQFLRGEMIVPVPEVSDEQLAGFSDADKALIRSFPAKIRENFLTADDDAQKAYLDDKRQAAQVAERLAEIERTQVEQQRLEVESFEKAVIAKQDQYVETLRDTTLKDVVDNLAEKVQFSADAKQNSAITGFLRVALVAALDPATAAPLAETFETLGIKFDKNFYQTSQLAAAKAQEVTRLKEIAANPRMARFADPAALRVAERDLEASVRQVKSTLAGVAAQFAKVLGASAKARAAGVTEAAEKSASRPSANGSPAAAVSGGKIKPFSAEWAETFIPQ